MNSKRSIQKLYRTSTPIQLLPAAESDDPAALCSWLLHQATPDMRWLLAHTISGVIWGRIDRTAAARSLLLSSDYFGPNAAHRDHRLSGRLVAAQLESCRLFGPEAELLLWRNGNGFAARRIVDHAMQLPAPPNLDPDTRIVGCDYFDEAWMLWGTQAEAAQMGFTLVADGAQGMRHAIPLANIPFDPPKAAQKRRPLRLIVRNYLQSHEDGMVTISGGRLVELCVAPLRQLKEGTDPEPAAPEEENG